MIGTAQFGTTMFGEGDTGLHRRYRTWLTTTATFAPGESITIDSDAKTIIRTSGGVETNIRSTLTGELCDLEPTGTIRFVWEDDEGSRTIGIEVTHSPRYA